MVWGSASTAGACIQFLVGKLKIPHVAWCSQKKKVVRRLLKMIVAALWTVARQASLSMGFSRQEYWSGLRFSLPEDLSNPGIEPWSPALQTILYRLSPG